ncbi:DUF6668 family protein [Microbacterium paludicola]|uniref:DUF6668 family protein n=1 Tax=Microbacterium paludicola TaxID=300019 RepID=UPI00119DBE89|nr:DUF6668 family protein [Microbacterium paludicola]
MSEGNPWVSRPSVERPAPAPLVERVSIPTGPTTPQLGVPAPEATDRLTFWDAGHWSPLWIVGAHGGAGESTLASLIPGATATDHRWPQRAGGALRAVVTARSNLRGLAAAQAAAQQWASRLVPGVDLLGLVVMADAPGRLPRPLRDRLQVVSGGFARTWTVPWIDTWRTSEVDSAAAPREVRRVVDELTALANTQQKG